MPENSEENVIIKETAAAKPKVKFSEISSALVSRTFIFTIFLAFTSYWLLTWIQVWMPSYLLEAVKVSSTQMGYISVIIGLSAGLVTICIAMLSDYIHKKAPVIKKIPCVSSWGIYINRCRPFFTQLQNYNTLVG
ncbi:hypothetical protein RCO48_33055 [Peribacillus frigoritolerans]|nr:hypothetical protein [Peribacillus frigoritolerans]